MQPLVTAPNGVVRFQENSVVIYLLDEASAGRKCDMNSLACQDFPAEDREQFAQLIGYSLSGFSELSYVRDETYAKAAHLSENPETHPVQAEVEVLRELVQSVRVGMRDAIAELYGKHPDDLIELKDEDGQEDCPCDGLGDDCEGIPCTIHRFMRR